jgi:hypothetical protein
MAAILKNKTGIEVVKGDGGHKKDVPTLPGYPAEPIIVATSSG